MDRFLVEVYVDDFIVVGFDRCDDGWGLNGEGLDGGGWGCK